jgi:hypothetical protein
MKKITFKYADEEFDVVSIINGKDHEDEDELDLLKQCFVFLLRKLDYTDEQINGVVRD